MDVFLDGPEGKVRDGIHIVFASEKTLSTQLEANAAVHESEMAGDFRLISLQALVRMKLGAFRDKDRVYLRDLADVGLIDETWLTKYSPTLSERLPQISYSPEG